MQIVTVPGGTGVTIAIPFTSSTNAAIATQLLANLYYAAPPSVKVVDASTGAGTPGITGDVNEFVDDVAGQVSVPSGYQYLVGGYYSTPGAPYPSTSFLASGTLDGAILNNQSQSFTFTAGTGNATVVAGGYAAALTINTRVSGGGNGVLDLDGSGTETVNLASGSWSVTTGLGSGSFVLGSGTDSVTVQGADTVTGGAGAATVKFEQGHDLFIGGSGQATVVDFGTDDTVMGGRGAETVFGQGNLLHIQGGQGQVELIDDTGGAAFTAGPGGAVAFGGVHGSSYVTGGSYFFLISGGGNDSITAARGSVAPIVFGAPGGQVHIAAAAAGSFVVAGGGGETITASQSSGGVTFFSGTGAIDLVGAPDAANFYCASSGDTTMSGGIGNVYEFINGHAGAVNTITDFTSHDSLYLSGFGTGPNAGIATEIVTNGTLNLTLTDGTRIVFDNLNSASELNGHIHNI